MAVTIADTHAFVYCATAAFASSALSSDLLVIRFALTMGFLFLVFNSLRAYAGTTTEDDGYMELPMTDGVLDVPLMVNMILFVLNAYICLRFVWDERPHRRYNDAERALFRYFQSRCGLTPLQFRYILAHGDFVDYAAQQEIPHCPTTLYLVLEGKVSCRVKHAHDTIFGRKTIIKRSGEFFDVKLFNFFLPVGFDNTEFRAQTVLPTKLFRWKMDGLVAMRDLQSPRLRPYWEYIVLRSLAAVAVRSHLKARDTLYDSLSVPERPEWLEGAPSRDFGKPEKSVGSWEHVKRQCGMIRSSLLHIIPPRGVRQRPSIAENAPKQAYFELLCRAHGTDQAESFRFSQAQKDQREEKRMDIFWFLGNNDTRDGDKGNNANGDLECPS